MRCAALAFLFLVCFAVQLRASDDGEIRIAALKGSPARIVMPDGSSPPVKVGERIPAGSVLTTPADSSLALLFANGAVVVLEPRSELRITRFRSLDSLPTTLPGSLRTEAEKSPSTTKLHLDSGLLFLDVPALKPGSRFEVSTPVGFAGIRGTRFYVRAMEKRAAVGVAEGLVIATSLLGQEKPLGAGSAIGLAPEGLTAPTAGEIALIRQLNSAFGIQTGRVPSNTGKSSPQSRAGYKLSD